MLLVSAASGPSRIHRLGLFSRQAILAGMKIAEYRAGFDIALTPKEVEALPGAARAQFLRHAFYARSLRRYICDGDDGRFTNHSDDPNSRQEGGASYAVRDIRPNEEITLDYRALDGEAPPAASGADAVISQWVINGVSGMYLDRTATGWGLFTARPAAAGEHLITFAGREISLAETLALGAWSMYPVQIGEGTYLDCDPPTAFLNHHCEPTAVIRGATHLVARRALRPRTEITMDYSACMSGDPEAGMVCQCGAARCRGTIGNFEDLPESIQRQYLKRGEV